MRVELTELVDTIDGIAKRENFATLSPHEIRLLVSAIRSRLAAGDQKPFAWHNPLCSVQPIALDYQKQDMRPERAAEYNKPLYAAPQPAPGWDEAIEAVQRDNCRDRTRNAVGRR